jgi:hypothetical protein
MDQVRAAVRQYVMLKSTEFVMRANDTKPRLVREERAMGESNENALTTMVREARW